MTKMEFLKLVRSLKSVYTRDNFIPDQESADVWFSLLSDMDYGLLTAAAKIWILQNKFPPTVAELREQAAKILENDPDDWSAEWEKVISCVKLFGMYRETEALASLDEMTRSCVMRVGFQNICRSENVSIERANFRMIYENMANRQREEAKLPEELRKQIGQIREAIAFRKQIEEMRNKLEVKE